MKTRRIAAVIAASTLALVLAACSGGDTSVTLTQPQQSGISVTGTGSVTVAPDIAVIGIGIEVLRPTVSEARAAAAEAMNAMQQSITGNGVDAVDISTRSFNIYPRYADTEPCLTRARSQPASAVLSAPAVGAPQPPTTAPSSDQSDEESSDATDDAPVPTLYRDAPEKCGPQIIGYTVNNQVSVKVRDLDSLSDVLDGAIEAGGNSVRVNNVSFTVDEPEQYFEEARAMAIADARERAEQLASLAGASLGQLRSISESGGRGGVMYAEVASMAAFDGATSLNPGQQEVSLTVYVVYDVG